LTAANLPNSAASLREELAIGDSFDDATRKKYEGLLEKKWTSVVRLQKKVTNHQFTPWHLFCCEYHFEIANISVLS